MTMWVEGGAVVCKIRWIVIHVLQYEYVNPCSRQHAQPKMSGRSRRCLAVALSIEINRNRRLGAR